MLEMASSLHHVRLVRQLTGVVIAHLALLVGCYHPDLHDCTVECSSPSDCASGQMCGDGWCAMPGTNCKHENDNQLVADATTATVDARDLCPQGCTNGTCVAGVCVIDCSAPWSCQGDVMCPANLPCRIVCGYHACAHHLACGLATSCDVQCTGDYACTDEIQCNENRCQVTCSGISSCKRRTRCMESCACDVACSGAQSCAEVSECPASSCVLGRGCTSQVTGCDKCL